MAVILVEDLMKQYRSGVQALNGLSLKVEEGEIFSLLGPNGAGKSTLINILSTYLRPTSGTAVMLNKSVYQEASAIRSKIACVAQKTSIDSHLSLRENMLFQSRLYKIPKKEARERMENLVACFQLERYMNYPAATYSGGIKRRLDIALNMMSSPKILFLDEPTVGMDIQSRRAMWEMMNRIRENFGTTIFLTTHYLEEADRLSDTICIIRDGKEIVQGTPDALRNYLHKDLLKITFWDKASAKTAKEHLLEVLGDQTAEWNADTVRITVDNGKRELQQIANFLLNREIAFKGIEITQPAIEDVFIRLTSSEEGCA